MDERRGLPRAGEEPELRSAEPLPDRDQHVALTDVLAARPDVRARGGAIQQPNEFIPLDVRVLDRHDDVGAGGNRRARRDVHRLAGADGPLGLMADQRSSDDLELARVRWRRPGEIGRASGEPVHRRGGELGQVVRRQDVLGHHAPVRIGQRQLERRQRLDLGKDAVPRILDRDQPLRRIVVVDVGLGRHRASVGAALPDDPQLSFSRRASSARYALNSEPTSSRSSASSTVARR